MVRASFYRNFPICSRASRNDAEVLRHLDRVCKCHVLRHALVWSMTPTLYMQINSLQRWCAYRVLARVPLKVLDDDARRSLFNKARKKCEKQGLWAKKACHTIHDWSEHLVRGGSGIGTTSGPQPSTRPGTNTITFGSVVKKSEVSGGRVPARDVQPLVGRSPSWMCGNGGFYRLWSRHRWVCTYNQIA